MFKEKLGVNANIRMIPMIAILIASEVVLTRLLSINLQIVRIGFGFLPPALIALAYGPLWAGAAYALGDIIGALVFPTGAPFPGFTLTAFLTGFVFGIFLYKPETNRTSPLKVLPATLIVCFALNLALDTLWLYILLDKAVAGMLPSRILKVAIMAPIQIFLIPLVWNRLWKFLKPRRPHS